MRILIVGFYTKTYMPYIQKYEKILREKNIEYDITCFDRDANGISTHEENIYTFHRRMGTIKWKKVIPYFKYIAYVKKIIKNGQYDKLIVLTTVPAVLLNKILLKRYNQKYIFDFRDYSYEKYSFYKCLVDRIVANSFCTFISSKGFMHYLNPNEKINIIHNISNAEAVIDKALPIDIQNIVIGFVGYVRYYDINTALIECLREHPNIRIEYYGAMYDDCDLVSYVRENHIQNVKFGGRYQNEEKPEIYRNMTFINSIYSLNSKEVAYAIPNRLYDAALYKKPIIVTNRTYLAEVVTKYGLGMVIDVFEDDVYGKIIEYSKKFNMDEFTWNCHRFLEEVEKDERLFIKKINLFIR